jgi:hypothetical protein
MLANLITVGIVTTAASIIPQAKAYLPRPSGRPRAMTGSGRDRRPRENRDLRLISSIRTMPHVPGIGPTNNTSDGFPKNPCCLTRVVVASTKRGLVGSISRITRARLLFESRLLAAHLAQSSTAWWASRTRWVDRSFSAGPSPDRLRVRSGQYRQLLGRRHCISLPRSESCPRQIRQVFRGVEVLVPPHLSTSLLWWFDLATSYGGRLSLSPR